MKHYRAKKIRHSTRFPITFVLGAFCRWLRKVWFCEFAKLKQGKSFVHNRTSCTSYFKMPDERYGQRQIGYRAEQSALKHKSSIAQNPLQQESVRTSQQRHETISTFQAMPWGLLCFHKFWFAKDVRLCTISPSFPEQKEKQERAKLPYVYLSEVRSIYSPARAARLQ